MSTNISAIKSFVSSRMRRVSALVLVLALLLGATAWSARDLQASAETPNAPRTTQLTASHASVASAAPSSSGGLYAPNSTASADDAFGASVAIGGNVVVIGAPSRDAAYVFVKSGANWTNMFQTATLIASDNVVGDGFGASVAISGTTIVVGAPLAQVGGSEVRGAAYVFTQPVAGWSGRLTPSAKLVASDGAAGDEFGSAVAVAGTTIVVGAPFAAIGANYAQGAAYVFVNATPTAKLVASDGAAGDAFGSSVAISGNTIVVGAPWDDIGANADQGAAYVFVNTTQVAKLTASDGASDKFSAELGIAVSISGDTAVAGAWLADVGTNLNQGAAYVFVKPGGRWANMTQTSRLTSSETDADEFGTSVSIDGTTVVVGSPIANRGMGAGYVFVMPGGGWSAPIRAPRLATMTQNARLTSSDADADGFGAFAAISDDTITVGAPSGNNGRGAGYVFVKPGGGWSGNPAQLARLIAANLIYLPLILR